MNSKYGIKDIIVFSRKCYYAGLIVGVVLLCALITINLLNKSMLHLLPPCIFYHQTGLYCPGCGGTRSVNSFLHGHLLYSLKYHPFVLYSFTIYISFMLSHTLHIITNGRVKAMIFRPGYFYVGAAIVIVQWIIKNFILIRYGIPI